jgi:hypothetical protein
MPDCKAAPQALVDVSSQANLPAGQVKRGLAERPKTKFDKAAALKADAGL